MRRTTTVEVDGCSYNVEYLCPTKAFPAARIVITGVFREDDVPDLDLRGELLGTPAGARIREHVEQEGARWADTYSPGVRAEMLALEGAPDEGLRRLAAAVRAVLESGSVDADGFVALVRHRIIVDREEAYVLVVNRELRVWAVVDPAKVRLRLAGIEVDVDADREGAGSYRCGYVAETLNDAELGAGALLVWLHARGYSILTQGRPAASLVRGFFAPSGRAGGV
jgi:hypothetical protein